MIYIHVYIILYHFIHEYVISFFTLYQPIKNLNNFDTSLSNFKENTNSNIGLCFNIRFGHLNSTLIPYCSGKCIFDVNEIVSDFLRKSSSITWAAPCRTHRRLFLYSPTWLCACFASYINQGLCKEKKKRKFVLNKVLSHWEYKTSLGHMPKKNIVLNLPHRLG